MARMKPRVSVATAQAEASAIYKRLRVALPEHHGDDLKVAPLREHFSGEVRKPLLILFSSVTLLLLIACANAANLLLAKSAQRTRELAVRSALGAGAADVLALVLRRSVYLAIGGIALGTLPALWSSEVIAAMLYGVSASDPASFATAGFILAAIAHMDPVTALREQ
jgi:putative ABC transport system permease protein